jgi:hypothetical protein
MNPSISRFPELFVVAPDHRNFPIAASSESLQLLDCATFRTAASSESL